MSGNHTQIRFGVTKEVYGEIVRRSNEVVERKLPRNVRIALYVRMCVENHLLSLETVAAQHGNRVVIRECASCREPGTGPIPLDGPIPPYYCLNCLCNREQF